VKLLKKFITKAEISYPFIGPFLRFFAESAGWQQWLGSDRKVSQQLFELKKYSTKN
jgi:hypothetical protein